MAGRYDWTRFVCLRTESYRVDSEGYLNDPIKAGQYAKDVQPSLKTAEDIEQIQTTVVLGEPGIGKSDLLLSLIKFREENRNENTVVLYRNLNTYSSESFFVEDIFQSEEVENWKNDTSKNLYLYLDSLDECLLRIDTVSQLLANQISRLPTERLFIRLSCRTGVWSDYLENALKSIFSLQEVPVFEVTPLRQGDVEMACEAEGVDSENFLKEVLEKSVPAFAIKPVTLKFLIRTFQKNQSLPANQQWLYLDGCKQLCEEFNSSRKAIPNSEALSADVKFRVACRIAALSILSNKNTIWLGSDFEKGPSDLTLSDIVSGAQNKEGDIALTEATIRETLDSGLFTSRGSQRMGWAHQTYAEFLTAVYLSSNNLSIQQLDSLFFNSNPSNSKLVPQLSQAAAFLASRREDFLNLLLEKDPEILLRNDNSALPDSFKERAVTRIFEQVEKGESFAHLEMEIRRRFKGLAHPQIGNQIRPFITDKNFSHMSRRLAVDVAEVCNLTDLSNEIFVQALDKTEDYHLRANAAHACRQLLPESKRKEMIALLDAAEADPDDELRGYALQTLWPKYLSAQEVLSYLSAPRNEHFFGAYAYFLFENFTTGLSDSDIPIALEWAAEHIENQPRYTHFYQAVDRIIQHSWKKIESLGVLGPFAKVAYKKLVEHQPIIEKLDSKEFAEQFAAAVEIRRRIFLSVFEQIPLEDIEPFFIFSRSSSLLNKGDFFWLVDLADKETNAEKQNMFIQTLRFFVDWSNVEQSDAAIKLAQKHAFAAQYFKWMIGPIELYSEDAKEMKCRYEEEQSWSEKKKKNEDWPGRILGFISKALDEIEKGKNFFAQLVRYLSVDSKTGHYKDENQISEAEAWNLLDTESKNKIVSAAKSYLSTFDPEIESFLEESSLKYSVWAGTKALRLLAELDLNYLANQDQSFWEKWAPSLIAYPLFHDYDNEHHKALLKIANSKAQSAYERTVIQLASKDGKEHGSVYVLQKHEQFITPSLLSGLLNEVKDLPPKGAISMLGELVANGIKEAETQLSSYISAPLPANADSKNLILSAASNLMSEASDAGWSLLWPLFQRDRQFGREVILNGLTSSRDESSFLQKLTDEKIGEFYSWMCIEFPHTDDRRGGGWVGPEERAADLRNAAIKTLVNRGTRNSCDVIRALVAKHPNLPFLKWHLIDAEKRNRWLEWNPPSPSELLSMAVDRSKTLVNSEEDLLNAVLDSINRFEATLHGTTPALTDLWNTEKDRFQPKNENEISDRIKRHLDEDLKARGIIVNREVEIRKSVGPDTGQRTDIYVDAIGPLRNGNRERLTVIIEVKGCWHSEVLTAAETQLGNKYLKDNSTRHGIYLIADCLCEKWDSEDNRKSQSTRNNISEKFAEIERQSKGMADNGYAVSAVRLNCRFRT